MEKVTILRNSKKYGLKVGDEFTVKRNVMLLCVVIRPNSTNIVIEENMLRRYGRLTGDPELCFS